MRNYKRKSARGTVSQDVMERAATAVNENVHSIRKVAADFGTNYRSLSRFVVKARLAHQLGRPLPQVGYKRPNQVFSPEQENLLASYLLKSSEIYHGLTPKDVRKLAFECSRKFDVKAPSQWAASEMAGADWFSSFIKRNSELAIRTPEATSLARATSFNRVNVSKFFDNLSAVYNRSKYLPCDIYNVDETGVTTVQQPSKIVARKGIKQVGAVTSAERGTLVTVEVAVNALGNGLPPMFVFPRKNYRDHFINGGPAGCIGTCSDSGWMTEQTFFQFMRHFITYSNASISHPVLLLLDNHSSHISVDLLNLCKDNGITMLSFPPHCSHKLQPLDRTVYGPFKKYVNNACDSWMKTNPGKTMTIYDIPAIVAKALPLAITPTNITAGFRVSGIFPFDRDVFSEAEFAPSDVTDRDIVVPTGILNEVLQTPAPQTPAPQQTIALPPIPTSPQIVCQKAVAENLPSTSQQLTTFSPETIRPYPKAGPRKTQDSAR
jgi:hypothetical protein